MKINTQAKTKLMWFWLRKFYRCWAKSRARIMFLSLWSHCEYPLVTEKVSLGLHFTLSIIQNHNLFRFVSYLHCIFYVQFVFPLERRSIHLIQHMPANSQLPTILYCLESIFLLFLDPTQVLCFIYRLRVYIFLLCMEYLDAFLLPSHMECPCHNILYQEHMVLQGAHFFHRYPCPSLWPPPPVWSFVVQL